jgi:hypothetical protein
MLKVSEQSRSVVSRLVSSSPGWSPHSLHRVSALKPSRWRCITSLCLRHCQATTWDLISRISQTIKNLLGDRDEPPGPDWCWLRSSFGLSHGSHRLRQRFTNIKIFPKLTLNSLFKVSIIL